MDEGQPAALNPSKIEVLWYSSQRRQHQIPTRHVRIGSTAIPPVSSVRNLSPYRQRPHYEVSHHRDRPIVLRGTVSDS